MLSTRTGTLCQTRVLRHYVITSRLNMTARRKQQRSLKFINSESNYSRCKKHIFPSRRVGSMAP